MMIDLHDTEFTELVIAPRVVSDGLVAGTGIDRQGFRVL
jgi:hypothetical protein